MTGASIFKNALPHITEAAACISKKKKREINNDQREQPLLF